MLGRLLSKIPLAHALYKLDEDYECKLSDYDYKGSKFHLTKTSLNIESRDSQEWDYIEFYSKSEKDKSYTKRLKISSQGTVTVFKGYAWDGNSPKISIFGLFCIGTPDGRKYENKTITWRASLIHDALGQFKDDPNMPSIFYEKQGTEKSGNEGRLGRDGLYFELLKDCKFIPRGIYYYVLSHLGPLFDSSTSNEVRNEQDRLSKVFTPSVKKTHKEQDKKPIVSIHARRQ